MGRGEFRPWRAEIKTKGGECTRTLRRPTTIGAGKPRGSLSANPKRDVIVLDAPAPAGERPAEPAERSRAEPAKPAEPPAAQDEKARAKEPRKGFLRRHPVLAPVSLVALLIAGAAGYLYWDYGAHFESTDDAFIAARQFAIAPQVPGYVTAVPVTDNQHVDKGGVIAEIDQRDYRAALEQAKAQVTAAQAGVDDVDSQIAMQNAQIAASKAKVAQAGANLELARVTWGRDQPLVNKGWASAQQGTTDVQNMKAQQAAVDSADAALKVAEGQIDTLKAERASAEAKLAEADAQRDQAALNLGYTTVAADQPGRVVNLTGAVGQYAQAGTALSMFVPDEIWVVANFKETQLDRMRPGEPVTIEIDAYPERDFRGHVASVQPGSGPAFSLLPPENATGNYVKIVQRVPVKIVLDNPPADVDAGAGHVGRSGRAGRSVALAL